MIDATPPTSPHWIGFWAALAGLLVLWVWTTRRRTAAWLGRRRWWIAGVATLGFLNLGFWGNGVFGVAYRGMLGPIRFCHLPDGPDAAGKALEIALSEGFLDYHAALFGSEQACASEHLRKHLQARPLDYQELTRYGIHISPPPSPACRFLLFQYYDAWNFGLFLLGIDEVMHHRCSDLVQEMLGPRFDGLVLVELYRMAKTDKERLELLEDLRRGVSVHAEWIGRELRRFLKERPSAAVRDALLAAHVSVQTYVDNPARRGIAPDRVVPLLDDYDRTRAILNKEDYRGRPLAEFERLLGIADAKWDEAYTNQPDHSRRIYHLGDFYLDLSIEHVDDGSLRLDKHFFPALHPDGLSREERMEWFAKKLQEYFDERNRMLEEIRRPEKSK